MQSQQIVESDQSKLTPIKTHALSEENDGLETTVSSSSSPKLLQASSEREWQNDVF